MARAETNEVLENVYDPDTGSLRTTGAAAQYPFAVKITTSGSDTYVAKALIGSSQASAIWQAKKIAVSGSNITITWADGNANFDNIATDLTILTYS